MSEYWHGQKVLLTTNWFGKDYVLLQDGDGTIYALRLVDGVPQFVVD